MWCLDWEIIMCAAYASIPQLPTHVTYKWLLVFVSRLWCISKTLTAAAPPTITINKMIDFNRAVSQRAHRHGACKPNKNRRQVFAISLYIVWKVVSIINRWFDCERLTHIQFFFFFFFKTAERSVHFDFQYIYYIITFARLNISWNLHILFSPNLSPPVSYRIAHTAIPVWIVSNGARMQYARAFRWMRSDQMLKGLRQTRSNGITDGRAMAVLFYMQQKQKLVKTENFCIIRFHDGINGRCCCATQTLFDCRMFGAIRQFTHWRLNDLLCAQCKSDMRQIKLHRTNCLADKCAYCCKRY